MMSTVQFISVLGCAAALFVGCGGTKGGAPTQSGANGSDKTVAEKQPPDTHLVSVTSQGWESPADLGILMAEREGFFSEAGFEVWFAAPSEPTRPVEYVTGGTGLLGITQQPQLAMARQKGAPIIAVGSLVPQPTAALIWLSESKVRTIRDLKGKTIAIPGLPFQREFLRSVLARAGLKREDVKVESVGYDLVPALLGGRADAIFGGSANQEGIELRSRGERPVITPVQKLGIPSYEELVLIGRQDFVDRDPKLIRDFMTAVSRGVRVAMGHPRLAAKVIKEGGEAEPGVSYRTLEAEVKATLPLLSKSGHMNPARASALLGWMQGEGMIDAQPPASDLLTNHYLSGR
jgi:putative hydroxymethylpyrimidine transport system substrate-binding protein